MLSLLSIKCVMETKDIPHIRSEKLKLSNMTEFWGLMFLQYETKMTKAAGKFIKIVNTAIP